MKILLSTILLIILSLCGHAQVNAYARVSSISSTILTVSNPNETYASFSAGQQLIIMQMQDNVIGTNTNNNSSFGNLSTIASAGDYEVAVIASVTRSSGTLSQININSPLAKTFNTGSNSSVQVISYPELGSNGYTTTSNISAVPWNGLVGGVVAFRVNGTLTLNHNISANGAGFRGGTSNGGSAGTCDANNYRNVVSDNFGNKGEGIYRATSGSYVAGRGKIINGGGGGNSHNGGGGGGSNYSAGGEGGGGYGCSSSAGGIGGVTLGSFISADKVFMGGGGGAGEANNSYNTSGGAGGGIVIVKATQIITTGSGTSLSISANGASAGNVGNDGAGGGGAGGSVLLAVQQWNISGTKTLSISADGGSGGSVNDAAAHGGGGGGGQGAVIFSTTTPVNNITTTTLNGAGGRNYTGGTYAGSGAGTSNQGVFNSSFALLPVKLISFTASNIRSGIEFDWTTVNAQHLHEYELQRSYDNEIYTVVGRLKNSDRRAVKQQYKFRDNVRASRDTYYRLKMTDDWGNPFFSQVLMVKVSGNEKLSFQIHPNPLKGAGVLQIASPKIANAKVNFLNMFGTVVKTYFTTLKTGENRFALTELMMPPGLYHVVVQTAEESVNSSIVLQN